MHSAWNQVEEGTVPNPAHSFHAHPSIFFTIVKRKSIRCKTIALSHLLLVALTPRPLPLCGIPHPIKSKLRGGIGPSNPFFGKNGGVF
jgi:hypothetical protein